MSLPLYLSFCKYSSRSLLSPDDKLSVNIWSKTWYDGDKWRCDHGDKQTTGKVKIKLVSKSTKDCWTADFRNENNHFSRLREKFLFLFSNFLVNAGLNADHNGIKWRCFRAPMCPGLSSAPAHRVTPDSPVRFAYHHKWFLDHLNDKDMFLMIITINLIIWVTQICAPGYSMDGGTCRPRQEECPRGMFRLKQWKWFLLKLVLIRTFLDM